MNKELLTIALAFGCIAANASTNNYDLLGRKGSKMNSPMVYRNVDYSKAKKNEQQKLGSSLENRGLAKQAVGLKDGVKAIVGWSGTNGYGFYTCTGNKSGCGFLNSFSGGSISTYLDKANKAFIPVYSDNLPKYNDIYTYESAGATRSGYSGYQLEEAPYAMPFDELQSYASYGKIDSLLNRNYRANSNVGLYLSEEAVPVRLNPFTDPNPNAPIIIDERNEVMGTFKTMPGYEMRASRMYKLVHKFSDRSVVYVTRNRPSNPASHSHGPQAYIGVHGYGGSETTAYNSSARDLDNYIYNNRTIEVVAAGNKSRKMSAKGYAVNAITVGAIDALTGNKTGERIIDLKDCYDEECYVKPDIYNYSNFYIDDFYRVYSSSSNMYDYKPFYEGTEAATGVTAGMISDMLSYNGFYKWHPEVLKAVLLNVNANTKLDYNALVFNNKEYNNEHDRRNTHLSAYFIGDVNSLMKAGEFGNKVIRLELSQGQFGSAGNYSSVVGYDIAIAWLNSGNDIANLGGLPQKFSLYANPTRKHEHWRYSESPKGAPYRRVWVNKSSDPNNKVTIEIVLDEENPNSENYGQMVLGLDIMPLYE